VQPEDLLARLRATMPGGQLALTEAERAALLDLARVAAHASERQAAPLATFLAGCAYADLPGPERARVLQALVVDLERMVADAEPGAAPGPEPGSDD
jgi:hypothetical protein